MAEPTELAAADLLRQAQQYLQSLRGAGVEWLPTAELPVLSTASARTPAPAPPGEKLFEQPAKTPAVPLEQRRQQLRLLAEEVAKCQRCPELAATRTQTVFADGQAGVELCLVGEAPGRDEDAQGLPFVGEAGQLLNRILGACGLKREDVYICNTLKCRPPANRTPLPNELANCHGYLERQIELVQPRFICTLGGSAAQAVLGTIASLGKLRGRFHDYKGIPVLCTYHPAYLLPHRHPEKKREVWDDMKVLMARMGRPVK